MTTTPESLLDQRVYFVGPITIATSTSMWATGQLMNYGDTLTITDEVIEAGYPRDRRSHWLELVDDPDGQIDRYGEVKFGRGSFPDYLPEKDPHHITLADLMTEKYVNISEVINTSPVKGTFTVGSSVPGKDVA